MPEILAVLAAGALFTAVLTFWQSVRSAVGAAPTAGSAEYESLAADRDRIEREERLAATLRTLKDLELERDTDKLAEADYQSMSQALRAEAKGLLRRREADLGPYLTEARDVVIAHLERVGVAGDPDREAASPASIPADGLLCPTCGTRNDVDARFCKSCGARFDAEASADASSTPATEREGEG